MHALAIHAINTCRGLPSKAHSVATVQLPPPSHPLKRRSNTESKTVIHLPIPRWKVLPDSWKCAVWGGVRSEKKTIWITHQTFELEELNEEEWSNLIEGMHARHLGYENPSSCAQNIQQGLVVMLIGLISSRKWNSCQERFGCQAPTFTNKAIIVIENQTIILKNRRYPPTDKIWPEHNRALYGILISDVRT